MAQSDTVDRILDAAEELLLKEGSRKRRYA